VRGWGFALGLVVCACGAGRIGGDDDGGGGDGASPVDGGGPGLDAAPPVDLSAELYDPGRVPRFDLELPAASVAMLGVDPRAYVPATLRYGAETVANIGVHLKGEYNFRDLSGKAPFKLKFDEFVPGQTFRGLRRMTLNNALEDPSFVAERLTYLAFRAAGAPAPRCNNAVVTVNGELYGVYVNLETEDKTFLARWFASNNGNLYEELGAELLPGNEAMWDLETNELANDRSDLTALFAAIESARDDTLLADLEPVLDTAAFLRYSALEGIVNQWDGYAYTRFGPNNFRLYHDPSTGKFSFLPWGMDMAMKGYGGDAYLDLRDARGLILARCLGAAACRASYRATVTQMVTMFEALDLPGQAQAFRAQLAADIAADPRMEVDRATSGAVFDEVRSFVQGRPADVRAAMP